jgi:hypothetical protein
VRLDHLLSKEHTDDAVAVVVAAVMVVFASGDTMMFGAMVVRLLSGWVHGALLGV